GQKEHLVLEGVRAQRPAVAEHDRLSRSPVIEIDLGSVSCCDRAHVPSSSDGLAAVLAATPTPPPHEVPVMPCEVLLAIVSPAILPTLCLASDDQTGDPASVNSMAVRPFERRD